MSKIALLGDTHFGCRNGNSRFHSFFDKVYCDFFFPELEKLGIKKIIQLGDLWDTRKSIQIESIYEARRYFFDRLVGYDIEMITLLGNHDIVFRNTVDVNSSSVLLEGYKNNVNIIDKPTTLLIDGSEFLFVPWLCKDNKEEIENEILKSTSDYLVGHFELHGFQMFKGQPAHGGYELNNLDKFKTVFSGHFHHRSRKGNILYTGTLYEMTWQDYNDPKGFHILDTVTGKLEFVKNPYVIHQTIEYDDRVEELNNLEIYRNCFIKIFEKNKIDQYKFELFLDSLNNVGVYDIKVIDQEFINLTSDVDIDLKCEDTLTLIYLYIDNITINNKDKLKDYIRELYTKSLLVE